MNRGIHMRIKYIHTENNKLEKTIQLMYIESYFLVTSVFILSGLILHKNKQSKTKCWWRFLLQYRSANSLHFESFSW